MPQPEQPTTRRARRDAGRRGRRRTLQLGAAAALLVVGIVVAIAVATGGVGGAGGNGGSAGGADASGSGATGGAPTDAVALPAGSGAGAGAATGLPAPAQTSVAAATCADPAVAAALAGGSDADVLAAFGGAAAFRAAVAGGAAPCVDLSDSRRVWVIVDKQRPLAPIDFEPAEVTAPANMPRTVDGRLQLAASAALSALVAAASAEGAGSIGLNSAYRSYTSQTRTYNGYVDSMGREEADLQSARPGFSEHQTGLATDVAACDGGCAAIESFGGTPQGAWVAANAWRFGFVVRYEDGYTPITGYEWEPWHLRYIGPELAQVYHDGGFHTLEDFFGLPAAPTY